MAFSYNPQAHENKLNDASTNHSITKNDFIDPNPHAFYMFENFNSNKKVFDSELKLTIFLKKLRVRLKTYERNLNAHVQERKRKDINIFSIISAHKNKIPCCNCNTFL